jgi:tRNA A37 N6-isopentenylltransferase MiaA
LLAHLEEGLPLEQARADALRRLRVLARRQEAWFERDPRVVWFRADLADLKDAVSSLLGNTEAAKAVRH